MTTSRLAAVFTLIALPLLAGCGDAAPAPDTASADVARLTAAVESLSDSNGELSTELRRQARQIDGLRRDVSELSGRNAAVSGAASSPAAARADATSGAATAPPAGMAGDPDAVDAVAESAVGTLLATEAGRKVIEKAAAKELAKRKAQERRTFISYTLGIFARDAGLDDRQSKELQRIWKESLDSGTELRAKFAAARALPESEQERGREEAMEFMRDLGRQRSAKIADLLQPEQLESYQTVEDEIVDSLHGGPRRPTNAEPKEASVRKE